MGSSKLRFTFQWILSSWIFLFVQSTTFASDPQRHKSVVRYWATTLGTRLNKTSYEQSGIAFLRSAYKRKELDLDIPTSNGPGIRDEVNLDIGNFLESKSLAVRRIRESAENLFRPYNSSIEEPPENYTNALEINLTAEGAKKDPHFDYEEVLHDKSTIHVPTVVYNKDEDLLHGVSATSGLDETFIQNAKNDPSLKWQYFGSTTGFMRNYPGIFWETEDNLNLYDARQRIWYSQTIASPKMILFLIDVSGSQVGLAISMTTLMVSQTIDTLGDNDFFNIVTFNDTTEFLEPCFTDYPLQATYENKKLMKEKLHTIEPQDKSDVCDAFSFAFDTLARFRGSNGSNCSEMIMLFTDGVEDTCDGVFQARNGNKSVRVFTYLLGESVQHARILGQIACNNHGKYTRISVRSDVVEKVADYLPVIGRPLAQQDAHPTVWTNAYRDFQTGSVVITVSEPVHNTTAKGREEGHVLGVASVDVSVDSLLEFAAPYKFGVNGYFFMTTNNGYVTYHPRQRYHYQQTGEVIEGTSTQDILDFEQSAKFDVIRNGMINGVESQGPLDVEIPYESMKRIRSLTQKYYSALVKGTIFSLATVIATDGERQINPPEVVRSENGAPVLSDGSRDLINNSVFQLQNKGDKIKLADWIPCHSLLKDAERRITTEELVATFLQELLDGAAEMTVYCALDWINLFLLDWNVTFGFLSDWNGDYEAKNETVTHFLATTSGLNMENHSRDSSERFTLKHSKTLVEDYFARAVNDATSPEFVYSIPLKSEASQVNLNTEEELMTAYSAIQITGKTLAVSGYQMAVADFHNIFDDVTTMRNLDCEGESVAFHCNYTCNQSDIACLLIDHDGYIAASTDESQIGEHIATAKTDLFHELFEAGVFEKLVYIDHQGRCPIKEDKEPSSSWILLNPLSQAKNLMLMMFHKAFVILMTFNWYEWLSVWGAPSNASTETEIEYERCDMEYSYYKLSNSTHVEKFGVMTSSCYNSSYSLVSVVNTNLVLVVEDFIEEPTETRCVTPETYSLTPVEVSYNESGSEEERCESMWKPRYRQPPGFFTASTNESKSKEADECDGCFLRPSWLILASLVLYHVSGFTTRFVS